MGQERGRIHDADQFFLAVDEVGVVGSRAGCQ